MSKWEPVVRDTKQRILAAAMEVFGQRGAMEDLPGATTFLREARFLPALDAAGRADYEDAPGLVQGLLQAGMDRGDVARFDPCALGRVLSGALLEATHHILNEGDAEAAMAVVAQSVHGFALPRTVAP